MNAGLRYLLWAGVRGMWRRAARRMRTLRGFATTSIGLLFFAFVIGAQMMTLLVDPGTPPAHETAVQGFAFFFLLLLLPALFTADAPFFWPQEVQFLFAAPVSRRELQVYQMLSRGWVQVFSGLWFAVLAMRAAPRPAAAFPAVILALLFLFTATHLAGMLRLAAGDVLPAWLRKSVLPAAWAAGALLGLAFYRHAQAVGFGPAVGDAFRSPGMRAATLVVRPFGEAFAAGTPGAVLAWSAVSAGMVLAAAGGALAIRADFRERSLVSSARRFEQIRRIRRGRGGYAVAAPAKNRRLRVPSLAFLGAAAPLARRQAYELGRGLRSLLSLATMGLMSFFYVIAIPRWMADGGDPAGALGTSLVVLVVLYPLLASGAFTVDFRRDVERLPYLRSLPLAPSAVAVGEVFVAAAVIGIVNLLLLGATAAAGGQVAGEMAALAALVALPAAWLAVTLENWLFLLFPARVMADGEQQSAFMGKQLIKMFFKLCLLAVVGVAAALAALAGRALANLPGAAAGALIVVALACWGATLLLARAYRGFDLALDTPA